MIHRRNPLLLYSYMCMCSTAVTVTPHTGGPGSGKGRIVANLRSMFGMKLISAENIILKYLPKKVQHFITLSTANVSASRT